jgi:hypothetical protein
LFVGCAVGEKERGRRMNFFKKVLVYGCKMHKEKKLYGRRGGGLRGSPPGQGCRKFQKIGVPPS